MKVVGLGATVLDHVASVDEYPKRDTKVKANDYQIQAGGNCANTLVGLSRLGLETVLLSSIGTDHNGGVLREALEGESVTLDYVTKGIRSATSLICVSDEGKHRTIVHVPGPSYDDGLNLNFDVLEGASAVYLDGRFSESAKELAESARERGIPIITGAEKIVHGTDVLFPHTDILIASKEYHQSAFGNQNFKKNMEELRKVGPKAVITTLGGDGSIAFNGKELLEVPAARANVVDTTGAGDAYAAGIIYGQVNEWPLLRSMTFASQIAALKCRKMGAQAGLPYLKEVEHLA